MGVDELRMECRRRPRPLCCDVGYVVQEKTDGLATASPSPVPYLT